MEKSVKLVFFELLRYAINGIDSSNGEKNLIQNVNLKELYAFSKKHDLAHVVAFVLEKNGLLNSGEKEVLAFKKEKELALFRYVKLDYELGEIIRVFENAKIPFIPLKGAVIRPLYPEPWMRTSCDIDILVKKEDLDSAIEILKTNLNYTVKSKGEHDVQIYTPSEVHVELHFSLLEKETNEDLAKILDSVFDTAIGDMHKKMQDDLLYCYLISHVAKHVKWGGSGIKPIIDLYLINKANTSDSTNRNKLLKDGKLLNFSNAIDKLISVWFEGEKADEKTSLLEEYILSGGVYGNLENKVAARQNKKKNKFSYFMSRLFLPYKELKIKYPKLEKCKILFPYYQVKRWCKLLFDKKTKENAKKEFNESKKIDSGLQAKTKELFEYLDI